MIRAIIILLLILPGSLALSQKMVTDSLFVLPDTAKPFTLENLYTVVLKNHPVARQASLLPEVARQEIRLARGGFDPKIESSFLLKHYNGTEYYRLFDGALKMPTRSPVSPVVGMERNTGENLNPENYISPQYDYQQLYAGVALPLGQGLLTDERRTALGQAQLFGDLMEAEQVKLINKLLLETAKDYWSWYFAYYNYRLAALTEQTADEIFRRVRMNFEGGEAALIDTVQAKITLLERQVNRQEAFNEFRNTTLRLSVYLWDSLQNPLELPVEYAPAEPTAITTIGTAELQALKEQAQTNHPELRKLNVKLGQLELDRKLAREFLKPRLDVSYYMLNQPFNPEGMSGGVVFDDNYKLGVDFSFPLFLRKERAKVAGLRLKISNVSFERVLTERQIVNEIDVAHNDLLNNATILTQQRQMADNYGRLMSAELLNLENGESDLFKINIQQEKLFNAQSKLIKTIAQYEKQKAVLYWSAGVRPLGGLN